MARVLLVAPTIDRDDIGEAWVAYQWAHHLSERNDLTVLTYRKRGRRPVAEQLPAARVVEWLEPPLLGRAERLNSLMKPGYFPFAHKARRWIAEALAAGERFDIAHQPLPVAMRYPSPLRDCGIPYVIGPVGGSLTSPPAFEEQDTGPWFVRLRRLDALRMRLDPALRATYANADCVLGIAPYVQELLRTVTIRRIDYLSETGLAELPPPRLRTPHDGPLRLLFVGRIIRTKGARDLVAALAEVTADVVADIVGSGFDLDACMSLAAQLGVNDRVRFHGAKPRAEVDAFYEAADVFVFPSFREPGGNVVFEAMGHCLPLIVCDRGGPGAAVDDACALRVTARNPAQFASDLAAAINDLAADGPRRLAMGQAARRRVEEVGLWSSKVRRVEALYAELAHGSYGETFTPSTG